MLIGMIVGNFSAYILVNLLPSKASKKGFFLTIILLGVAIVFCYLSSLFLQVAYILILLCLLLYRFSLGIYFTYSRVLQLEYLVNQSDTTKLFAYIKMVNSLGGAMGPLIGALMLKLAGFQGVLFFSLLCFLISACLVVRVISTPTTTKKTERQPMLLSFRVNKKTLLIGIASFFHFIFEAQIYTYFTLMIKQNYHEYTAVISSIFTLNSILLIFMTIKVINLVARIKNYSFQYTLGIGASCVALVLFTFQAESLPWLYFCILLFTLGEIIAPQVSVIAISNEKDPTKLKANMSFYNLCTSSLGLGVGSYLGVYIFGLGVGSIAIFTWFLIFVLSAVFFAWAMRYYSHNT